MKKYIVNKPLIKFFYCTVMIILLLSTLSSCTGFTTRVFNQAETTWSDDQNIIILNEHSIYTYSSIGKIEIQGEYYSFHYNFKITGHFFVTFEDLEIKKTSTEFDCEFHLKAISKKYFDYDKNRLEFACDFTLTDDTIVNYNLIIKASKIRSDNYDAKVLYDSMFKSGIGITFYSVPLILDNNQFLQGEYNAQFYFDFTYFGKITDYEHSIVKVIFVGEKIYFYSLDLDGLNEELLFSGTYSTPTKSQMIVTLDENNSFKDYTGNIIFEITRFQSRFEDI